MVNAGAIATTALIPGDDIDDRTGRIVDDAVGVRRAGPCGSTRRVYASESATGDRNRALAHLLKSYGVIDGSVRDAVETYFRQCSVLVTVRDLAVMAATLAFGGLNPVTGERVVSERVARDVPSIMASCGMYDFSGEWLLRVGLPAKSGVSGGLIAVAPSQFGVAAFSPRLDAHGNSVRASRRRRASSRTDSGCICSTRTRASRRPASRWSRPPTAGGPARRRTRVRRRGARASSMLREIAAGLAGCRGDHRRCRELARTAPGRDARSADRVRRSAAGIAPAGCRPGRSRGIRRGAAA